MFFFGSFHLIILWLVAIMYNDVSSVLGSSKLEVEKDTDSFVAQQQLRKIYEQTKHMKYGQCWTKALEQLQAGCRQLSDEMQRRIAYAFTRCHLQSSDRDLPLCKMEQPMSECTNGNVMPDFAFNVYTEFFTHTQQICFHLQSQIWHEATEMTISKLSDSSAEVSLALEESSMIAQQMVEQQNISLQNQEELLRNERLLRENLHKSVFDVQKSHAETTAIIREQKALFVEVFDRVSALQKTMLGEFSSMYTFGFYVGASILAYILTSTPRTSSARICLFVLLTMNFFTEKIIVNYHLVHVSDEGSYFIDHALLPEILYRDTWTCRKVYCGFALLTVVYFALTYKDYAKLTYDKTEKILKILAAQEHTFSNQLDKSSPVTMNVRDDSQRQVVVASSDSPGVNASADASNDDLSSMTSYRSDADSTFVATNQSRDSSDSSVSSYLTGRSHPSTPLDSAMLHSFVRASTPLSRRSSISCNESVVEGVIIGGHNLRRRRSTQYRDVSGETVETFIKSVARVTVKRKLHR